MDYEIEELEEDYAAKEILYTDDIREEKKLQISTKKISKRYIFKQKIRS